MNKKIIMASLNKVANELDTNGLFVEADTVTKVMSRVAMDENDEYNMEDYFPYGDPDEDPDEYLDEDEDESEEDDDFDMGFEKEPFDYDSPEDEGDMYGDFDSKFPDLDEDDF